MTKPLVALYWVNVNKRQRQQHPHPRQENPATGLTDQPQPTKEATAHTPAPSIFQVLLSKVKRA